MSIMNLFSVVKVYYKPFSEVKKMLP